MSEEWRESYVEPHIMITLAGHCAVARARRPDRDGWKRQMDWDELICIHEAAHTVVAVAVGHHQNGAAVEKTENGCRGIAEHSPAMLMEGTPDHPTFEDFDKLLPDFRKATAYAQLAVGMVGWLRYLRTLWLRTDNILERHWLATKMLASELRERGVVRRDRAQDILDRWMPVRAGSIFEALGYQQPVCQYVTSTRKFRSECRPRGQERPWRARWRVVGQTLRHWPSRGPHPGVLQPGKSGVQEN